ncbi:MAG: T9SS type A sorting domain-containing protein [Fibrobacteres bacterium]|nr:T9SS type A sorting domain-containing protein [Fibrobacterota bacterium]
MKTAAICMIFCIGVLKASPAFVSGPTQTVKGDSVIIDFETNEATDVEVAVLDSTGRIIRHLAAGKLGNRAPSPFSSNSLKQRVSWDKKDDFGRIFNGSNDIRVGLGLTASFDRIYAPDTLTHSNAITVGLTVGNDGTLYILSRRYDIRGGMRLIAFDRNGNYLKTLHPYSGNLSENQVQGFGRIKLSDGSYIPKIYQPAHATLWPEFHFSYRQGMAITPDGRLVMSNSRSSGAWYGIQSDLNRLLIVNNDGSCSGDSLFASKFPINPFQIALSPDGKHAYVASGSGKAVYKAPLSYSTSMAPIFYGVANVSGSDSLHFGKATGVAVDASGRVYMSDSANKRIIIADSNSNFLKSITTHNPEMLQISKRTGALYVLSLDSNKGVVKLTKYSPYPAFDSIWALQHTWSTFSGIMREVPSIFTIDESMDSTRIYLTNADYGGPGIRVYSDASSTVSLQSSSFPKTVNRKKWAGNSTLGGVGYIAISPDEEVAYAGCGGLNRIDLKTGTISTSTITARDIQFSPDGNLYAWSPSGNNVMYRYNKAGQRIAFPGGAMVCSTLSGGYGQGPDIGARGFTISNNNTIYTLTSYRHTYVHRDNCTYLTIYDSTGKRISDSLINGNTSTAGLQVDRDGNMFVALGSRPKGVFYPEGIDPAGLPNPLTMQPKPFTMPYMPMNYYLAYYGSIFKFGPSGGSLLLTSQSLSAVPTASLNADTVPTLQATGLYTNVFEIKNALWQHYGISPSHGYGQEWGDPTCVCFNPRFAVDGFGRVIFPDMMRFRVSVLDNNKNPLLDFGSYGNVDQTGPGSKVPSPEIPLYQPIYVRVVNNNVYISDIGNERIVKVKLGHKLWKTTSGLTGTSDQESSFRHVSKDNLSLALSPNPVTNTAAINFMLPKSGKVEINVLSPNGKLIRKISNETYRTGLNSAYWDCRDNNGIRVAAGIYIIVMKANREQIAKRILISR